MDQINWYDIEIISIKLYQYPMHTLLNMICKKHSNFLGSNNYLPKSGGSTSKGTK